MITANQPLSPIWDHGDYQAYLTGQDVAYFGITKREYFSAMAMKGILSGENGSLKSEKIAQIAVKEADALINELNK